MDGFATNDMDKKTHKWTTTVNRIKRCKRVFNWSLGLLFYFFIFLLLLLFYSQCTQTHNGTISCFSRRKFVVYFKVCLITLRLFLDSKIYTHYKLIYAWQIDRWMQWIAITIESGKIKQVTKAWKQCSFFLQICGNIDEIEACDDRSTKVIWLWYLFLINFFFFSRRKLDSIILANLFFTLSNENHFYPQLYCQIVWTEICFSYLFFGVFFFGFA